MKARKIEIEQPSVVSTKLFEEAVASLTARDIKTSEVVTVYPEDDFEVVLHLLEHKNFSSLPVVLPPQDKVVLGILKIEDVLLQRIEKKFHFNQCEP
jgi:predicted transcriptional regulator